MVLQEITKINKGTNKIINYKKDSKRSISSTFKNIIPDCGVSVFVIH